MKKIIAVIISLSIILISLAYSIEINAYDISYYKTAYKKYNIEEATGKTEEELLNISDDLIVYLKNKGGSEVLEPHFNEREISHMVDVQNLFKLKTVIKYIALIALIGGIIYYIRKENLIYLAKFITRFFFALYALLGLLVGVISLNFSRSFVIFHLIFFNNDLWLLDPKTDLMIQMLPEGFFLDIAIRVFILFISILLIIQALSYIYYRKKSQ